MPNDSKKAGLAAFLLLTGASVVPALAQTRVDTTDGTTVEVAPAEEEAAGTPAEGSGEQAVEGRQREAAAKRDARVRQGDRDRDREHNAKR